MKQNHRKVQPSSCLKPETVKSQDFVQRLCRENFVFTPPSLLFLFFCFFFQQDCVFEKRSDSTSLRVYWSGQLRIYNCDACCRRWYFTFNGVECSTPAAIDATVYMYKGSGSRKDNLHRPRHVEGVCDKIHKGKVRVGFWVGNCAGYGNADAYTGWNSVSRIYVEEMPPPQAGN